MSAQTPESALVSATCSSCEQTSFSPGSELFDPRLVTQVKRLSREPRIAWRLHQHKDTTTGGAYYYYVEILVRLTSPFAGHVVLDAPANPDPEEAITDALEAARTCLLLEDGDMRA